MTHSITRRTCILILLILIAASCASSQAKQPLIGSSSYLTYTTPPRDYGDIDRKALRGAIIKNLSYLESLDSVTEFNYGGRLVSAEEVAKTQKTLLEIIETSESKEMIELRMDYMFEWYKASGFDGDGSVIFTGYYVPEIEGSLYPSEKYRYPLYNNPGDIGKDTPYYTRREIDGGKVLEGRGLEIAWLADPVEAYFLHIQGSGILNLPDGSTLGVHYAGNNGHSYTSIGKILIEQGLITPSEGSLQGIKKYLWRHPDRMSEVLFRNARYIFFSIDNGPVHGSLKVPLTPGHSIATDPEVFPKGGMSFISTIAPVVDASGSVTNWVPVQRIVINQDEGGAIKGPGRVDIFWGKGAEAGLKAGSMKERGELYFFLQK